MEGVYSEIVGERVNVPLLVPARRLQRKHWSPEEIAILREHYPVGGINACVARLPDRNERTIYTKAAKIGLRSKKHRVPPTRWTWSLHQDDLIRRAYREDPRRGRVKRLARKMGRPAYAVSLRARQLGLVAPSGPGRPWAQREHDLIVAHASNQPISIARILKRNGFKRTPGAIQHRLNAMRIDRVDDDRYTGNGLAELMGVNVHKVASWIAKGWLKAKRERGDRTRYSIHRNAVRRFIVENVGEVDLRRVDKLWFVDLLAGSGA